MARQPEPLQGWLVMDVFDDWTGVRPMRAPEFDFLGIAIPRIFTAPNCTLGIVLSERNGFSYEYFS